MSLVVQEYLRVHGTIGLAALGIVIKQHPLHPNLLHFKYVRDALFDLRLVRECRGLILDSADDYRAVAVPYFKFFNAGDPLAATIDWRTAVAWEKLDGSLISLYYYDQWHVATTGIPDAGGKVGSSDLTFAQLFWRTAADLGMYSTIMGLPEEYTYMFELCCPENRVVVRYDAPGIYLTGARNNVTGLEVLPTNLVHIGLPMPQGVPVQSLDEATAIVLGRPELETEGVVVCDADFNRIKVKSPTYLQLHRAVSSMCPRAMANIVRNGEGQEFIQGFPIHQMEFDDIKRRHETMCLFLRQLWEQYGCITDRKKFALAIKDFRGNACLFALRDDRLSSVEEWLRVIPDRSYMRLIGLKEEEE